jgi:hypothetical protein
MIYKLEDGTRISRSHAQKLAARNKVGHSRSQTSALQSTPPFTPPPSRKPVPPKSALETYRSMESGIGRQAYLAEHGQTLLAQERKLRTPLADARPPADNVAAFDAFVSYEAMPAGSEKRAYLMADMRKIHLGSRLKDEQKRTR